MLHSFPVGPQPGLSPSMQLEMSLSGVLPASHPKAALVNTIRNEHQCVVNKCCVALLPTLRLPQRKVKACTKASADHNMTTTTPFPMANSFGSVLKFLAGFTQAPNCPLSSLDLEINTLTAIPKSFSGDLNFRKGFPSLRSLQGERSQGKDQHPVHCHLHLP